MFSDPVPQWAILPYWVLIVIAIINIISIYLESSTKVGTDKFISFRGTKTVADLKRRDRINIISRIYVIAIYTMFTFTDIPLDWKTFLGRRALFWVLLFDSYCNLANYVDYNWYKIVIIFNNIKLKLKSKSNKKLRRD